MAEILAAVVSVAIFERVVIIEESLRTPEFQVYDTRVEAYKHLCNLIREYGARRVDMVQFSGQTALHFLRELAQTAPNAKIRILLQNPSAASKFDTDYLLHVLPKGFVKIRHFGFLANRCRRDNVLLCRKLLAASSIVLPDLAPRLRHSNERETDAVDRCPRCKVGSMRMLEILLPQGNVMAASGALQLDTS